MDKHMHGLVQSGHFSAKYTMIALMVLKLSESFYEAWLEHTVDDENVPAYPKLMEFLDSS